LKEIKSEINKTKTYRHNAEEIENGVKLAWRNNAHCIGKVHWKTLKVFDSRDLTTEEEIFEQVKTHINYAWNDGKVRSVTTLFRPRTVDGKEIRIWNPQFIRYAGYEQPDGSVRGDPDHVPLTNAIKKLGWKKEVEGDFDVLPVVIQIDGKLPKLFELAPEYVTEIPLVHPKYPEFQELGLKWHGLPAISNMRIELGGIVYTAAPFNGWYMNTEISRNMCDANRYNLCEKIAKHLGLFYEDTKFWRDRVFVELNEAIIYSFEISGAKMVDHVKASQQFLSLMKREEKEGREVNAKYSWIVPPSAPSMCPVFHTRMKAFYVKPLIEYQPNGWDGSLVEPRGEIVEEVPHHHHHPQPVVQKSSSGLREYLPWLVVILTIFLSLYVNKIKL